LLDDLLIRTSNGEGGGGISSRDGF